MFFIILQNLYKSIILSAFCGMLVYIAVEGFKVIEHHIGKYLVLILAIAGFIICGFESVYNTHMYNLLELIICI